MFQPGSYWQATRHPWACAFFVLPLLIAYEVGLHYLASDPTALRNGADVWLRLGLVRMGLTAPYWAPALLVGILLIWSVFRQGDRPGNYVGVWIGMVLESSLYAAGLWAFSQGLWPAFERQGLQPGKTAPAESLVLIICQTQSASSIMIHPLVPQLVTFIGAGIYEETLFRLLLLCALIWIFKVADLPWRLGEVLAIIGSSLLFAAAHNLGPNGEAFQGFVFFFRTCAGLYFALLYRWRGFGIAVGAHAGYDVMVGIMQGTVPDWR
jgi:membrane protease YdiL (CAAX protease family)